MVKADALQPQLQTNQEAKRRTRSRSESLIFNFRCFQINYLPFLTGSDVVSLCRSSLPDALAGGGKLFKSLQANRARKKRTHSRTLSAASEDSILEDASGGGFNEAPCSEILR